MKVSKVIVYIIIFFVSLPIFLWLESGFAVKSAFDLVKPLIFSVSLVLSVSNFYKRLLLISALILLGLMVIFYLFWKIDISNLLGSIGFGILTIYILGFIPELFKKGFVEKI